MARRMSSTRACFDSRQCTVLLPGMPLSEGAASTRSSADLAVKTIAERIVGRHTPKVSPWRGRRLHVDIHDRVFRCGEGIGLGVRDALARQQPRHGEVFVDGIPMDAHAPADEPPAGALLR